MRTCTDALVGLAKSQGIAVVITGHVTKDGDLAGPRTLEHAVDIVLSFDGDPRSGLRVLAGGKNRFGTEGETAWFEMGATGLREIDPTELLVSGERVPRRVGRPPGSTCDGSSSSRPCWSVRASPWGARSSTAPRPGASRSTIPLVISRSRRPSPPLRPVPCLRKTRRSWGRWRSRVSSDPHPPWHSGSRQPAPSVAARCSHPRGRHRARRARMGLPSCCYGSQNRLMPDLWPSPDGPCRGYV